MKIAVMQPYLFPYIGYFQLIHAVDRFIIYDDVQYIKNGWINRNVILNKDKKGYITLPIKEDHYQLPINKRFFSSNFQQKKRDSLKTLYNYYHKAPYFKPTFSLVEHIFSSDNTNIADFVSRSIMLMVIYLKIPAIIVRSSNLLNNKSLGGEIKIIDICRLLNASKYVNSPGGIKLYHKNNFSRYNIELSFLKSEVVSYHQWSDTFYPNLSIIDVLMFNSVPKVKKMLLKYEFV